MHILITNDDGVLAPGLLALAQAMRQLGTTDILAPDHNWSASGHVRTLDRPLRAREIKLEDGSTAWTCDGAPSDCVALATCGFFSEKFDLVVSGINPNANLGHDVTYSGTVTAAMEAAIIGIPAIAVSLDAPENHLGFLDYNVAAQYALKIARATVKYGLAANVLLNVNVPYLPADQIKGIQITRQGLRVYHNQFDRRIDPRGRPYYWTFGEVPGGIAERGSDIGALADGYVSVTPIQLDLTAYTMIPDISAWKWQES